jgi:hypothetical protein
MRKIAITAPIIFVFMCFSCQKNPESVVLKYFKIANEVVNGDTLEVDYLKSHLSKNAQKMIDSLPLLMPYSLLSLTKKGTLMIAEIKNRQAIKKDSIILTVHLIYFNGHVQAIQQAMVYEENEWKLSISTK